MTKKIIPCTPIAFLSHNHYYFKLNVKKLSKISQNYDKQRSVNNTRVQQIVEFQNQHIREYGAPLIVGTIVLAKLTDNLISMDERLPINKYFVIDGQHRLEALKRLIKDHIIDDLEIVVECLEVPTPERMFELFQIINRAVPVPQHFLTPNQIINDAVAVLSTQFPKALSDSEKPQRPSINIDRFKNALMSVLEDNKLIRTTDELVKVIKEVNKHYYELGVEKLCDVVAHQNKQQRQIVSNAFLKCEKGNYLFIGCFKDESWIVDI